MSTNNIEQLLEGVLRHGPDIISECVSSDPLLDLYFARVDNERLNYPLPKQKIDITHWNIPNDYYPNLVEMLYAMCETTQQTDRVDQELGLFIKNNMYDVLHCMKYIVDTLRENNVVWGVGRGSSVSSYVLYLIGVHKIDSIKYNLPIEEFFKEI